MQTTTLHKFTRVKRPKVTGASKPPRSKYRFLDHLTVQKAIVDEVGGLGAYT